MSTQLIRLKTDRPGVKPQEREPVVGQWYCGMQVDHDYRTGESFERGREFMRYEGDGVWSGDPDDSDEEPIPGDYDYLQEQV